MLKGDGTTKATCGTCCYFDVLAADPAKGLCRRHAPPVNASAKDKINTGHAERWPVVCDDDWCGEWKSQIEETKVYGQPMREGR